MALSGNVAFDMKWENKQAKAPVAGGAIHFYKGAILNFNAAGYLKLGTDTTGETFAGIALEELNQLTGVASGTNELPIIPAKSGTVMRDVAITANITQANILDAVYVDGDDAMDIASGVAGSVAAGVITKFVDTNLADVYLV